MCYYQVYVQKDEGVEEYTPEEIVKALNTIMENRSEWINLLICNKDVLIQVDGDSLHLSVYNPDEEICIPSRNHSSATASPGRSVWSRGNKQEKNWTNKQ